ncbi:MAG TPA: hypothetical protein ENJ27_00665 [Candidatus Moranbacteria bacterium]|nr:hypothetical protein [Candidatus Moranbacteria bacterium]
MIDGTVAEAENFGISGTPAIFINDKFKGGVVKADELKSLIDEELGKTDNKTSEETPATTDKASDSK